MSIAKLIANEESNNEFVKDNSDTLKSILGIAGVAGNGQTTLAKILSGHFKAT